MLGLNAAAGTRRRAPSEAVPIYHGGDLAAARERFPAAPLPWVDLSTGINPQPYPIGPISDEAWHRLPDAAALAQLETVAARAYGAAAPDVVAAPGAQALIQVLPRVLRARRVAVLGFGYQEHPSVWRAAGAAVETVETVGNLGSADVAVVVNPNNPDGCTIAPARLAELAGDLARRGGTLVVDEAFMDVMEPGLSLVPLLPERGAIVLRSFGKAYGLAGVRLGFAVAGRDLAAQVRSALGPWAVSGPAIEVATRALGDEDWLGASVERLRADAARLDALLDRAGFGIVGGTPLFRLAARTDAADWFERLGRAGILVRPFPLRPNWLRFGLPADSAAWARLAAALGP